VEEKIEDLGRSQASLDNYSGHAPGSRFFIKFIKPLGQSPCYQNYNRLGLVKLLALFLV
jgi:hypothetical protein